MLAGWPLPLLALGYLGLLFAVAWYARRMADRGRSVVRNPHVYTLSIAVYCTAWTFFGSVGWAASNGLGFLPIYLGPTLMAGLWWYVLRKVVRITRTQHITSIADFIASRYGKSALLGGLVTVVAVLGIMPYISLQLKAVATSYVILSHYPELVMPYQAGGVALWEDTALLVAVTLGVFSVLFGTRYIDATERHEGMVAAVAFESLVKLVAFLVVGAYITFWLFDGPADIFRRAAGRPALANLLGGPGALPGGWSGWLALTVLAMSAILCLPRQFQVAVVECADERHVARAAWLFPLYLLAINLFVLPIALGGSLLFADSARAVDPDTYVLTVPMADRRPDLALLAFIGGLSAATGMVIVATVALSTMVCNDLVMPVLLRVRALGLWRRGELGGVLLAIRRLSIVGVLLLGYLYFRLIGESYALVTIGLVSFSAAAQFAPPILFGIYWKGASRVGAIAGLAAGAAVWAYTLVLPGFALSGWLPPGFVEHGPFGIEALRPYALLGLEGFDPITHSLFWSMLANCGGLVGISLFSRQSAIEQLQARLFVDAFREPAGGARAALWSGEATVGEIETLLARFLGEEQAAREVRAALGEAGARLHYSAQADARLVAHAERTLAGMLGAASARVTMATVVKGEAPTLEGVLEILDESSRVREYSHRLEQKSRELEQATRELRAANERLKELDRLKDDFVSTVSHELRTPLTSIRAFLEILKDNPDLDPAKRGEFLDIVVKESERLTRLINEVLDLAKIESGWMNWRFEEADLREVVRSSLVAVAQLFEEREVRLHSVVPEHPALAEVDRDRLTQVLINLLSNAAKFCEPRIGRVVVRLVAVSAEGYRIDVSDNGPGIPPDQLERIFEKFRQVDDERRVRAEGTGLGLAIAERIISRHGGRIWVDSRIGEGTTFSFSLPVRQGGRPATAEARAVAQR